MEIDPLEKSLLGIQQFRERMPEQSNAYLNFTEKVKSEGKIPQKFKSLINISLSIQARCKECILFNTENAIQEGATAEEISEAAMIAVAMSGGPSMMYLKYVIEVINDYQ